MHCYCEGLKLCKCSFKSSTIQKDQNLSQHIIYCFLIFDNDLIKDSFVSYKLLKLICKNIKHSKPLL